MTKTTKKAKGGKAKSETKSVISAERASSYHVSDVKTASGRRKSVDNNDKIAKELRGADIDTLAKVAKRHKVSDRFDAWQKKGLNPGMIRMNLGNVLRAQARNA